MHAQTARGSYKKAGDDGEGEEQAGEQQAVIDGGAHPLRQRGTDRANYRDRMLHGEIDTYASERLYVRKDGSNLWVSRTVSMVKGVPSWGALGVLLPAGVMMILGT